MKFAAIGLVGLVLTGACAVTSMPTDRLTANAAPPVQSQIAAATAAWNEALVIKDVATLHAILASEFVLTTNDGNNTTSRDQWFQNLQNMTIAKIDVRVLDVRTEGNVAVAQIEGEWDVTRGGRRVVVPFRGADSWILRDGRWQVFRRQMAR
jgi:ketosteroid isomerase-like protein